MSLDDDIRILSGVGLFEGFTPEQLRLMAFGAESISLRKGRTLYWEGGNADCAFVVASGSIALYHEDDAERTPIALAGTGEILGEMALISDTRRMTSAYAQTDTQVLRLNRSMFRRILEEYPEVAVHLHGRILQRFQALVERIEGMAPRFEE